jgi:hypothetical protein
MHLWNPPARIRRIRAPGAQVWLVAGLVAMLASAAATAQTRPALVRSVDEPARVPYAHFLAPTCPFGNVCIAEFPVVPAGKRLRLTQVSVVSIGVSSATGIVVVNKNSSLSPLLMFPVSRINSAYYSGNSLVGTFALDMIFEAGERPVLELGVPAGAGGIPVDPTNKFGATGYLVDVLP